MDEVPHLALLDERSYVELESQGEVDEGASHLFVRFHLPSVRNFHRLMTQGWPWQSSGGNRALNHIWETGLVGACRGSFGGVLGAPSRSKRQLTFPFETSPSSSARWACARSTLALQSRSKLQCSSS